MKLLLVRHAIAEERGPRYPDDSLRPLTAAGIEKMREATAGIERLVRPNRILTSPFTRASFGQNGRRRPVRQPVGIAATPPS